MFNVGLIGELYCVLYHLQKWYCAKKKKELKNQANCKMKLRSCVFIFLKSLFCMYEIILKWKEMSKWLLTFSTFSSFKTQYRNRALWPNPHKTNCQKLYCENEQFFFFLTKYNIYLTFLYCFLVNKFLLDHLANIVW